MHARIDGIAERLLRASHVAPTEKHRDDEASERDDRRRRSLLPDPARGILILVRGLMAVPAFDFMVVAAPLVGGAIAVVAIRLCVVDARRREEARVRRLLKSFDRP
ncbi:MAG: hypothetical protein ACODAU_04620 [Myxococcota bacterium]